MENKINNNFINDFIATLEKSLNNIENKFNIEKDIKNSKSNKKKHFKLNNLEKINFRALYVFYIDGTKDLFLNNVLYEDLEGNCFIQDKSNNNRFIMIMKNSIKKLDLRL